MIEQQAFNSRMTMTMNDDNERIFIVKIVQSES